MAKKKNTIDAPIEVERSTNNSIKIKLFNIKDKDALKHYLFMDNMEISNKDRYLIEMIIDMDLKKAESGKRGRMLSFGSDITIRGRVKQRVTTSACLYIVNNNLDQKDCFLGQDMQHSVDLHFLRIPFDKLDFIMGIDYGGPGMPKYVIKEAKEKKSNGKKKR